jgi:hypothetical protein
VVVLGRVQEPTLELCQRVMALGEGAGANIRTMSAGDGARVGAGANMAARSAGDGARGGCKS